MQNEAWVREYIHKLFICDIEKRGVKLRNEKLNYINFPLYKYCYVCEEAARSEFTVDYNIENFEKDILFFQNPSKFNDPFDCYLGFSQSKIIRDLLMQEFKKKKQLTPNNRKAINILFNDQNDVSNLQSFSDKDFKQIIETTLALISEEDPLKGVYDEVLQSLYSQDNGTIQKLITNTLTIRDKQILVDIMYSNPGFQKFLEKSINPDQLDYIIDTAPHDMKIKIEGNPDSFMSDNNGETLGIFDFLKIFSGIESGSNFSIDELDYIKQKFNEISKESLEKSRKLISEQFRVTCLSERMNSPLMWSHYANKHYGFCLEYDFTPTISADIVVVIVAIIGVINNIHTNKKSNDFQSAWNQKQLDVNLKSKARIEWIQKVRNITAELIALL